MLVKAYKFRSGVEIRIETVPGEPFMAMGEVQIPEDKIYEVWQHDKLVDRYETWDEAKHKVDLLD